MKLVNINLFSKNWKEFAVRFLGIFVVSFILMMYADSIGFELVPHEILGASKYWYVLGLVLGFTTLVTGITIVIDLFRTNNKEQQIVLGAKIGSCLVGVGTYCLLGNFMPYHYEKVEEHCEITITKIVKDNGLELPFFEKPGDFVTLAAEGCRQIGEK